VPFRYAARDIWRGLAPALLSTCVLLACSDAAPPSVESTPADTRPAQVPVPVPVTNPAVTAVLESVLSFDEYFERFGRRELIDLPTRTIRKDLLDQIASELVDSQIKWDGYVQSTNTSASGGVILLISPKPDSPKTDVALVRVAAAQMVGGSFVAQMPIRVIGRFLKLEGVFPVIDAESLTKL
jgi:hypothetical protein